MSLIKCSECGKEISDKSKVCIHCGVSIKDIKLDRKLINWLPLFISSILFFMIIAMYRWIDIDSSGNLFYEIFNSILLIISGVSIFLCFYVIPKNRKVLFPLSVIIGIFVFLSIMGTAFRAFN